MKIHSAFLLYSILFAIPTGAWAQADSDTIALESRVEPIESASLQGAREATEAEKAYARQLAEEREEQAQIDYNLPPIDENGQVHNPADFYGDPYYYDPWYAGYWGGFNTWRLHKGMNVNISASAFANFGKGMGGHGAGFSQDITLMYVTNLSKKATLAIGGYINNLSYSGNNYLTGGINALFAYRWNEHWSAYAYVQKAINGDHILPYCGYGNTAFGFPYWGGYGWAGYGYRPFGYVPAYAYNRAMDRIGGGVTYQWGERNQNSITINVEMLHQP